MFRAFALCNRSDERITLETSVFKLFAAANLRYQLTKLPCYTLPPTQHHSFFQKLDLFLIQFSELFINIFHERRKIFEGLKNTIASILRENMYGYLSLDIICSSKLTVSASWNRKFVKMTADKYPHLFQRQIGAIVYIALDGDLKFSRAKHSAIQGYILL